MLKYSCARQPVIRPALRPGETRARGRERLESQALQVAGAAHVQRIRNDETPGLVQLSESLPLVGDGRPRLSHANLRSPVNPASALGSSRTCPSYPPVSPRDQWEKPRSFSQARTPTSCALGSPARSPDSRCRA